MHAQTQRREERLLHAVPDSPPPASEVVAVVAGEGNRALYESLGATQIVEGGQSMNPAAADLLAAIERARADDVIVLPNNPNVVLAAEQAAGLSDKRVSVIRTDSIPAGLAALVAFDPSRDADANVAEMEEALAAVATGAVTVASKDAQLNGLRIRKGNFLGLAGGKPIAEGASFDEVATAVVERLLAEPRGVMTLLTGAEEPDLAPLIARVEAQHPDVELEVHEGGQPHYPLLLSAE
jgi:dihydroxyacetone kinase-like predicted kinase